MKYDLIIIGFGKGGKTLASKIASEGKKVSLIERDEMMYGGTCINVGCIPSKSLINSAKFAKESDFDSYEDKANYYKQAIEESKSLTAMLRKKNFDKLNNDLNIKVYHGVASFISNTQVKISFLDKEPIIIEGNKIVINTGAKPFIPDTPGLKDNNLVYTSASLMKEKKLPKSLAILGGGNIALEFAAMYANFGCEVHLIQRKDQILAKEDDDIVESISEVLSAMPIHFHLSTTIKSVENANDKAIINCLDSNTNEVNSLVVDAILVATGRVPNTDDLNIEATNIETNEKGIIKVNDDLLTSVDNIWAIGDVVSKQQFTYTSLDDYRIVYPQIKDEKNRYNLKQRQNIPTTLFIDPAYARVGLSEKEALDQGYQIKVVKMPAAAIPKAQLLNETKGMLKVVINEKNNLILGAMLFCVESYEVINIFKLAIDTQIPYQFLKDQIYTHPTMSEAINDLLSLV